jgi:hypothetical protein
MNPYNPNNAEIPIDQLKPALALARELWAKNGKHLLMYPLIDCYVDTEIGTVDNHNVVPLKQHTFFFMTVVPIVFGLFLGLIHLSETETGHKVVAWIQQLFVL